MKPRRPAVAKPPVVRPERVYERCTAAELTARDEWEQCRFVSCDLTGADLSRRRFIDCTFERCNLSLALLTGTGLQHVAFVGCKLAGLPFTNCRDLLFEVSFLDCHLRYASFVGKKLRGTRFTNCALDEVDFTGADLSEAVFEECSLPGALFEQTLLSGADLRSATGFRIDPERNRLDQARFRLDGLPGLLAKYGLVIE